MDKYLIVSLGAALGGALRYWTATFVHKLLPVYFPYGTLTVNFAGSFLLGFFVFYLDEKGFISPAVKIFLTVGFCGGYTTFSTFSFETLNLLKDSQFILASLNVLGNVFLSLFAVYLSYIISKLI